MLIRTIPFLTFFVILVLLPTGCDDDSTRYVPPPPPPPDFPVLASAFKFVGCCSVVCSLVWAYAIVTGSNNRSRK